MFIDKAHIHLKAGNGEWFCSFQKRYNIAAGGPNGGDGGHGGNIIY